MAVRSHCQRADDDLRSALAQLPLKPAVNQTDISRAQIQAMTLLLLSTPPKSKLALLTVT
jgi:hypothetical protein